MDIIAAIATGHSPTAIGIVRVSGEGCFALCEKVFRAVNGRPFADQETRKMVYGEMLDSQGRVIDQGLAVRFPGLYLTDRFSPGYGDLPLSLQPGICAVLDAERRVGIHVTPSFLMNPSKSVTAVIGLSDKPQMARIRGCAWCAMRETCTLRKGGKTCGL